MSKKSSKCKSTKNLNEPPAKKACVILLVLYIMLKLLTMDN